jgi:alkylation response protein AidB-like acyl-CoA dehydrogenase
MAKLFASIMSEKVSSAALKMHGGYGFLNDFPLEKYYRDAMVFQLYDGTNEIQKLLISREIIKSSKEK